MSMYHPSAQRTDGIEIEKDAQDHGVKTEDQRDDKTTAKVAAIQTAGILAASYHTGQPAKSTDSEIFEAINGLQTRTHISHIGFIVYR